LLRRSPEVPTRADVPGSTEPARLRARVGSRLTSLLVGAGFVPVWLATGVLLVIALIIAPETLSADSLDSGVLPFMTFLAVAALGQMLVIMTGGIDLSTPGVIVLVANLVVGVSSGEGNRLAQAIVVCLAFSALIGLVNGLLVGVARLNPLIVTLAVGQIVIGVTIGYARSIANESAVPTALSSWVIRDFLGVSWMFWVGVFATVVMTLVLRQTSVGRRFQSVGANPRAAWMAGIHVQRYVVLAYVLAATLYGTAGILLAGFIRSPSIDLGDPYLLGPIAAVVIGGASLAGGLASVTSTWVAAFALTLLSQMLRVLGLTTAWQYLVYGIAIAAGMVISGDRIVGVLGSLLQRPHVQEWLGSTEAATAE
jgi:ribose/xylose/arabinose/galactoside ABC-type transport system permease subunit